MNNYRPIAQVQAMRRQRNMMPLRRLENFVAGIRQIELTDGNQKLAAANVRCEYDARHMVLRGLVARDRSALIPFC